MSQPLEIFFDGELGRVCAVLLIAVGGETVSPAHVAFAYRLVGPSSILAKDVSANWSGVLICTPDFAKAHKSTPAVKRPERYQMALLSA